ERGGIVAVSGGDIGCDLLPDAVIETAASTKDESRLPEVLKKNPALVGYSIGADAVLAVRGRRLEAITGTVTIHLVASPTRPAKRIVLSGKKQEDLTALRRSALARSQEVVPAKAAAPVVEKGTLVIIGGGGIPKGLIQRFIELAGGKKACIVT